GVDIADFNNDNLPDILTLDMLPEENRRQKLLQLQENYESFQLMQNQDLHKQYMRNMLQLNNGDGSFSEIGQLAGISNTDWSWCPLIADFDNDGLKDIFITTGYLRDYTNKDFLRYWGDYKIKKAMDREPMLMMDLVRAMPVTPFKNYIYKNNGDLSFSNKQQEWGFTDTRMSNAAVYADLDNDGDLDLVISNINEEAFIYRNNASRKPGSNYLSIDLAGKNNTAATGAKVNLYSKGINQYQELNQNRGYLSAVSTSLHFGTGAAAVIDSVVITWPDNKRQVIQQVNANQRLKISYEPAGKNIVQSPSFIVNNNNSISIPASAKTVFEKSGGPIVYKHNDLSENDFKRQPLMLFMYSKTGPVIAKGDIDNDGLDDFYLSGDMKTGGYV
ncbi:MAG: CRTAC1 family protein, partial [Chitinophagaceae bacterium]